MAGHGWPSRPAMAMASHDRPWPTMAGRGWSSPVNGRSMVSQGPNEHSFSILMLEARKFDQKIRPESENRNATMAGHGWPWLVMAGHGWPSRLAMGWPWPAMAGHGRAWLVMSGQWPVNGQPRTQRSSTWQRLALRSCFWPRKLHFASGSNPSAKSQTQDPKPKLPKQNSQTPQLRVQRNPKHNSQTRDLKPQIPNRCYSNS